ncbi:MAG: tRNA 2-thiouridine(34) synthase MnmA [Geobacteraceae bacterium]
MVKSYKKKRVVVAMSGGVDSSVTAALLKEEGYEVIGVSMQLWDYARFTAMDGREFGSCCSLNDIHDARRVADQLGIPFYVVNFEEEFQRLVIDDFVDEYFLGRTPNPCVRCNQRLKFELLLMKARGLGADFLATGHYAQVKRSDDGRFLLYKGADRWKDQSYFLFTLTQEQLAMTLFPLGGMSKREVRDMADRYGLRVAQKKESQEICFIPDNNYVRFLEEARGDNLMEGEVVDCRGKVLGRHSGVHRFTVGQRKGLGIAHPAPLYVLGVNPANRQVVVGEKEELSGAGLIATDINWIVPPAALHIEVACKIRYRHEPAPCRIYHLSDSRAEVRFLEQEKSITPGQAVVFYDEDLVLGGGWIEEKI